MLVRRYSTPHVGRLDAIRFVAAVWVVLSHGILPSKQAFSGPVMQHVASFGGILFDGVAAVMVFFIVSGLCIHMPHVGSERVRLVPFYLRRCLRIGIPLLAVLLVMALLGGQASVKGHEVLWSIYAELAYYTIYPLLFALAKRTSWTLLIAGSSMVSIAIVGIWLDLTHIDQLGTLAWLWGLPIWLLGCLLAEIYQRGKPHGLPGRVAFWRALVWLASVLALLAVFHSPVRIGYPVSMLLFGVIAFCWLIKELEAPTPGWSWLERCGAGTYSLYLVHNVVLGGSNDLLLGHSPVVSLGLIVAVAGSSYLFYVAVEAPAHAFARYVARSVGLAKPGGRPYPFA